MESSSHLQFYLSRLKGLVEIMPEGSYRLTEDGGRDVPIQADPLPEALC